MQNPPKEAILPHEEQQEGAFRQIGLYAVRAKTPEQFETAEQMAENTFFSEERRKVLKDLIAAYRRVFLGQQDRAQREVTKQQQQAAEQQQQDHFDALVKKIESQQNQDAEFGLLQIAFDDLQQGKISGQQFDQLQTLIEGGVKALRTKRRSELDGDIGVLAHPGNRDRVNPEAWKNILLTTYDALAKGKIFPGDHNRLEARLGRWRPVPGSISTPPMTPEELQAFWVREDIRKVVKGVAKEVEPMRMEAYHQRIAYIHEHDHWLENQQGVVFSAELERLNAIAAGEIQFELESTKFQALLSKRQISQEQYELLRQMIQQKYPPEQVQEQYLQEKLEKLRGIRNNSQDRLLAVIWAFKDGKISQTIKHEWLLRVLNDQPKESPLERFNVYAMLPQFFDSAYTAPYLTTEERGLILEKFNQRELENVQVPEYFNFPVPLLERAEENVA